jgi:nitrogen fixation NifU-like protein
VKGKSLDEAKEIKNSDIASHLKLPPVKIHCSMLAADGISAAVEDVRRKMHAEELEAELEEHGVKDD